jgi:hypothetical protein
MTYTCPVCGYKNLPTPPNDFSICPSCGTEFGNDDFELTHEQIRQQWINAGAHWFSDIVPMPENWDLFKQLLGVVSIRPIDNEQTSSKSISLIGVGNFVQQLNALTSRNAHVSFFTNKIFSTSGNTQVPVTL